MFGASRRGGRALLMLRSLRGAPAIGTVHGVRNMTTEPMPGELARQGNLVNHVVNHFRRLVMPKRKPVVLAPGEGRTYAMGPLDAIFKVDEQGYSISEWWLEPKTKGPGAHSHEEDDIFYVLEGTMSILVSEEWIEAQKGSFVLAPGGVTHDFENRSEKRAGMLNVSAPGQFEEHMPGIADWFRKRSKKDSRTE
jgi:mannose-6-phosphate isomerase-like protein (cupin superfamily)